MLQYTSLAMPGLSLRDRWLSVSSSSIDILTFPLVGTSTAFVQMKDDDSEEDGAHTQSQMMSSTF